MAARYDIFVIGGGINGCGIARDAAGRGYSVCLAEMGDLASGTSSASTKLVHGGLRYLEFYEFRLVREALFERERLWANAPHIIRPMHFVLPHHAGLRPAWLLRLGLFLYDHLGGRKLLPACRSIDLTNSPYGAPLKPLFTKGFEYSDCWVDDSRLVVLNARDAADRGARILTRREVTAAKSDGEGWTLELTDTVFGHKEQVSARALVNAAGPWVDEVLRGPVGEADAHNVRLVKGSHIVVPRIFDHDRCYIFQNADGRIIFAIPYEDDFTLIGTTDLDFEGDPSGAEISGAEVAYLCEAASQYFRAPVREEQVAWSYSGVRPLFDDGATKAQEATRDYVLREDTSHGAPLFNIFGGKITTYRRLAESMLDMIAPRIGRRGAAWTADAPLPGGDMPVDGVGEITRKLAGGFDWLPGKVAVRYARSYGTRLCRMIETAGSLADMGRHFGAGLYEREVRWLIEQEWARTAQDVLWRRTRLGLRIDERGVADLERFMTAAVAEFDAREEQSAAGDRRSGPEAA